MRDARRCRTASAWLTAAEDQLSLVELMGRQHLSLPTVFCPSHLYKRPETIVWNIFIERYSVHQSRACCAPSPKLRSFPTTREHDQRNPIFRVRARPTSRLHYTLPFTTHPARRLWPARRMRNLLMADRRCAVLLRDIVYLGRPS